MVAQMLSADEGTIGFLVHRHKIIKLLNLYCDHAMEDVKVYCLWAISNVAGSEEWVTLFEPEPVIVKLAQ